MKTIIKQLIGYTIMVLIVASVIWFIMYKCNEKVKAQQIGRNTLENMICTALFIEDTI